jgi:N-acetylneuraminic acid mutarotase
MINPFLFKPALQSRTSAQVAISVLALAAANALADSTKFPELPTPVTSFGACVSDGWVYVYGGHAGEAHKYSLDTTLFDFRRCKVDGTGAWKSLPGPARAQGASLVAHADKVIRVGGLSARNETIDEDENLVSLTDVTSFDPTTQRWAELPALPKPRSSHDSVVVDGKLYVLGGWELSGSRQGSWHEEAWVLDLERPRRGWKKFSQPFKRRAVAVAAVGHWIVAMGGMDSENYTSLEVDLYDTKTRKWSKGPELPDGPMDGFGAAACVQGDTLYVTTYLGKLLQWQPGATDWSEVGEVRTKRFFHRMLPVSEDELVLIGGASRKEGHLADVEVITIK